MDSGGGGSSVPTGAELNQPLWCSDCGLGPGWSTAQHRDGAGKGKLYSGRGAVGGLKVLANGFCSLQGFVLHTGPAAAVGSGPDQALAAHRLAVAAVTEQ